MKFVKYILLSGVLLLAAPPAMALNVFACEPEWGALAAELGGDKVVVYTATTGAQDPHRIEARPSLIAQVRRADLVVCTGAELEIAWLPLLQRQAGNARVLPGQPGDFAAADYVQKHEIPKSLDRSEGDVHPYGNPHVQTDPRNIARVAAELAKRLRTLDAGNAAFYQQRYDNFAARWREAIARWEKQAAPLKGVAVVSHHKGWVYLYQWLGLREVAVLEPRPGVPPSSAHLANVLASLRAQPAKMVIHAAYQDSRPSEWLAAHANVPLVTLPFTVGGTRAATDLFTLFDVTIGELLKAAR